MMTFTNAQLIAAAKERLKQDSPERDWGDLPESEQERLCDHVRSVLEAAVAANKVYEVEHIIAARLWKRRDEWILELSGSINDTGFNVRHVHPGTIPPENVVELPLHYAWHTRLVAAGLAKEDDLYA